MIHLRKRVYSLLLLSLCTLTSTAGRTQPPTNEVLAVLTGHTDTIEAVVFSPDNTVIATASFDRTARLWDAATGQQLRILSGEQGHKGQVLAVDFSPDGEFLATGGADNVARVWQSGLSFPSPAFAAVASVAGPAAGFQFVGEFLAPLERRTRRMALASANPIKSFPHPNLVDAVAYSPNGQWLATGCHDGKLRIWDIAKGMSVKEIEAHVQKSPQQVQHPIYAVTWTPDGQQIYTASFDKTIKLWNVVSGQLIREFKAAPEPVPLAPKKDMPKKEAEAKAKDPGSAQADPSKNGQQASQTSAVSLGHRDQVFSLALSPDGKFLVSGSSDRTIKLWDTTTGQVVRDFPNPDLKPVFPTEPTPSHPGWVQTVRFTADGKFLVSAGPAPRKKGYVAVWNVQTGERVWSRSWDAGPVHGLALTSDGARMVIGCAAANDPAAPVAVVVKFPGR